MAKKHLLLTVCLFMLQWLHCNEATTKDPLLIVVLMVKNEASVIKETLQPFVEASTKNTRDHLAFLIFDTGSTDSTIPIAQQYFEEQDVKNAVIKQEPFVDFATSRNRGLELAEEAFPAATFMLMLDAEWRLHNVEELVQFCQKHKNNTDASYLIRIILNSSLDYHVGRLIRCKSGVQFVGVVHESLNRISYKKVPSCCFFEWNPGTYGQEKSKHRWSRDIDNLLKEYEHNPQNPRTIFYIAQTYQCLNDLENACLWYKKRINNPGWNEENFLAHYRLAQAYEKLGNWDAALCEYLKAFSMRPHRAEPLVRLAQHYWETKEIDLCFLFSRRASEIPYPDNDILFIDKELYTYDRHNLLGISAWYVGEYELGRAAIEKALEAHPNYTHLLKNYEFYTEKNLKTPANTRFKDDSIQA